MDAIDANLSVIHRETPTFFLFIYCARYLQTDMNAEVGSIMYIREGGCM